jgi:hypothetical protein
VLEPNDVAAFAVELILIGISVANFVGVQESGGSKPFLI